MGKHTRARRRRSRSIAAALTLPLIVAAVSYAVFSRDDTTSTQPGSPASSLSAASSSGGVARATCATRAPVAVAVPSGFAPVLAGVADSACLALSSTIVDDGKGAALLARGSVDAWIADSRVRAYLAGPTAAAQAPSVAVSPIVLSANPTVAAEIAGQSPTPGRLTWAALLQPARFRPLTLQIQDPATSSVAMVLAAQLSTLAQSATHDSSVAIGATAQAISAMTPTAATTLSADPGFTDLRISEERLVRPVLDQENAGASVVNPLEGSASLDYPWLSRATARPAAATLLRALLSGVGTRARAAHGFHEPGSKTFTNAGATDSLIAGPAVADMAILYGLTGGSPSPTKVLAVADVSGSMGYLVDGSRTLIQVANQSLLTLLPLLPSDTTIGVWEFGSRLGGDVDYLEVLPSAKLAANRARLISISAELQARRTGTALYNTTLAAYRQMQSTYDPRAANIIAIFTDGKNEDASGLDLPGLLTALKAASDPRRPVSILFLGYGEADIAAMRSITAVTGGAVYPITSPNQMITVLISANAEFQIATQR